MTDIKKMKAIIREMKAEHSFSKCEAAKLSIVVDLAILGKDAEAIQLAQHIATGIEWKALAVQKFVGFLKGEKEQA